MTKTRHITTKRVYPRPGTHADRILAYVGSNDRTTTNGIISGLKLNPSIARKCISVLVDRGLLKDRPDENGHHHYSVQATVQGSV